MTAQVLYVDTLFALNFAMNYLSLFLCGCFLRLRRRFFRLLLAAALGGAVAVLEVVLAFHFALQCFIALPMAMLLCLIAYRKTGSTRRYFAEVAVFWLISLLLGGSINAMRSWMSELFGPRVTAGIRLADVVLLLGLIASAALYVTARFFRKQSYGKNAVATVRFRDRTVSLTVLVDSGCLLNDPISGKPAMIVRLEAMADILPNEIVACARSRGTRIPTTATLARRCRFLPAKGLGETQLLLSIRPDMLTVTVEESNRTYECDALVALIETGRERFAGCDGLLPSSLIF